MRVQTSFSIKSVTISSIGDVPVAEYIWAPWRIEYIRRTHSKGCALCQKLRDKDDVSNHVLLRGNSNYVMLNAWPYNPGHLMVIPNRHVALPEELSDEEMLDHCQIVNRCMAAITRLINPAGFNIGMNLGTVAGAGIPGHIHTHIVPRWEGDTNCMPVIADTRVVPEALDATYQKLQGQI